MSRPETGPMQFPGDWPGLFIRGDQAFAYAAALETVLPDAAKAHPIYAAFLHGLIQDLRSCDSRLKPECQQAQLIPEEQP